MNKLRDKGKHQPVKLVVTVCALLSVMGPSVATQQTAGNPKSTSPTTSGSVPDLVNSDEHYRIGPGDVLDIRFYNRPQLSGIVRVSMGGSIQLPLLEGEIRAACKTEEELSKDIATGYLKYQRHPYVSVMVKEYSSSPVAVVGAVDKPGRFQLTRRIRLLELLAYAGGPTDKAGGQIVVAHIGGISLCASEEGQDVNKESGSGGFTTYGLKETLRGDEKANPWIEAGDMVSITEADQAYVIGNVFHPQPVPLKERVTVSQAIAMAGGILPATKSDRVQIMRRVSASSEQKLLLVDLRAINQRTAEDVVLQANDIIDVPTSAAKKTFASILSALGTGASSVPYIILRR